MSSRIKKNLDMVKEKSFSAETNSQNGNPVLFQENLQEEPAGDEDFDSDDSVADPDFEIEDNEDCDSEQEIPLLSGRSMIIIDNNTNHLSASTSTQEVATQENRSRADRGRKLKLKGDTRKARNERKVKRNTGMSYVTLKGKTVRERMIKPLDACRQKCIEKIAEPDRETIFRAYWAMNDYNRRVSYIASLIEIRDTKTMRKRCTDSDKQHFRQISAYYHLQVHGKNISVCKACFLKTFDETNKFIENVIQKKRSETSGIIHKDQRGTHAAANKKTDDEIDIVRNHILSIPTYEGHYTRRDSKQKYLPPFYTLAQLYIEYRLKYPEKPVSRKIYETEFHKLGIKIKQPNKDTCQTCDKLAKEIDLSVNKTLLKEQLDFHHLKADETYKSKANDRDLSKDDPSKQTITFDMQQCLPTPVVQSSLAFYKRQLWTFNFTVHDCDTGQAHYYMWHEGIAKRGGNAIGSCLYKYLVHDLDKNVQHVTMYSDTCGGQNKNSYFAAMCMVVLQDSPTLKIIDHKFLLAGHTHMECDADHSIIEKKKKKCKFPIEHPHDWVQLVRQSGKKKPFQVTEMVSEDFMDFADLFKGALINRKIGSSGSGKTWRDVCWLRYERESLGTLKYKSSLAIEEPFQTVSFKRKGKHNLVLRPKNCYNGPIPITVEKKANLLELLPYIFRTWWDFYNNLITNPTAVDVYPDANEEDES